MSPEQQELLRQAGLRQPVKFTTQALQQVAQLAELMGGCQPGIDWGKTHTLEEVAETMPSGYALWVIENLSPFLTPEVRSHFLQAAVREKPTRAGWMWQRIPDLTESEYALLQQKASTFPQLIRAIQQGELTRADRRLKG